MEGSVPGNNLYYIQFYFDSDALNTYEGVYLDDIEVLGDPVAAGPNLAYNWPSNYWWAIVACNDPGTYGCDNVFGIEPTYIDWSMRNDGDADAPPFHVGLYLDSVLIHEWSFSGLAARSTHDIEDYVYTISTGPHYLMIKVDNRNEVNEQYEDDNNIELGFWWHEPRIYYSGWVEYYHPLPPHPTLPARKVRVSICDSDPQGIQVLDTTSTDNSGWFTFSGIDNSSDGDNSMRQDIFFRLETINPACSVCAAASSATSYYESPVVQSGAVAS
jgi:hypothetical protein